MSLPSSQRFVYDVSFSLFGRVAHSFGSTFSQ